MVTDFQDSRYNKLISYYEKTISDAQDEMAVWIKDMVNDLKLGVQRNSIRDSIAMSLFDTILYNTGNPDNDYISYEQLRNVIHNFNLLTNSTLDINYR